ncbi:uncharacterized protein JN550_001122 [Neoarthrinium moseri]|uniref:uncharacterized protein n=1 Tax=Neoarthrinium moseri TaxID=1658444 RepID=UPI001FDE2824|nr:uncharacterized protein JN550_001122 [Neoarthrinium moseri]KAI1877050.1 hypothetical protein JN550_001122 [Neoarthrinium moseri]
MLSLYRAGYLRSSLACRACRRNAFSTTVATARSPPRPSPRKSEKWARRADSRPATRDILRESEESDKSVESGSKFEAIKYVAVGPGRQQDIVHGAPAHAFGPPRQALKPGSPGYHKAKTAQRTYEIFGKLALTRVDAYMTHQGSWLAKREEYKSFGIETALDFEREVKLFKQAIERACALATDKNDVSRTENPLFWALRSAFVEGDVDALTREIKHNFYNFLMRSRFSKNITATHAKIADFRFPYEWFPATRALQRTVHLHVGPTNSGKTYNALKALEEAKSGVYAGPLRLLAHEVYSRFVAKGKPCALVTGEEQRIPDVDNYFRSCTVEMTPLNYQMDVAVIDEIQMIGDSDRGWAWTQAFLGVQAKEVHVCGEERTVELIQSLCKLTGDKCIIHRYERLSPLQPMDRSLGGNLKNLEKGDAVIAFSRVGIHSLKQAIEKATGKRCAIVYGSLPPETRAQQAALFNDPDNDYDFLAASDAVGMGLNLEIRRVIFEATHKRDKYGFKRLSVSEIKQIGGRAGRFRSAARANLTAAAGEEPEQSSGPPKAPEGQMGLVTAMEDEDLGNVSRAFSRKPPQIKTAGLQVPPSVLERFSAYFPPNTPLSYIILRLRDIATVNHRFHMCNLGEMVEIADLIQPFPMSVYDRCVFLNAPVSLREENGKATLQAFARCASNMTGGDLLDIPAVNLELLDTTRETYPLGKSAYLKHLEALHKSITLYLWLSYRYSGVFRSQKLAFHVKELVEARINEALGEVSMTQEGLRARNVFIRKQAADAQRRKKGILGGEIEDTDDRPPENEGPGDWNEEGHQEPLYEDPSEVDVATKRKDADVQ